MFNSYYNNLHNNPLFYFSNIYNSYISLLYMQSLQIEANLISRSSPPFKLLVESNIEKKEDGIKIHFDNENKYFEAD